MASNRESSPLLSDARNENNQELGQACPIVEESAAYSADDEHKRLPQTGRHRFDIWDRSTPAVPLVTLLLVAVAGFVSVGLVSTISFDGPRRPNEPVQYGPSIGDGAAGVRSSAVPGKRDQGGVDPGHGLPTLLEDGHVSRPVNNAHERPLLLQPEQHQPEVLKSPAVGAERVAPGAFGGEGEQEARSDDAERGNQNSGVGDTQGTKPNVFVFFIDDMGWNDMGYQSTDLNLLTPNMDRLAAGGVKLTNYYSMHVCTPARAALMTGRYPVRYGMQYGVVSGGATWGMPPQEKIMPQYFNSGGYESHMVGKWHLGMYLDELMPNNRGFDTYLGYLHGEDDYWTHENTRAELMDSTHFYDFGFGNSTGYYDVNPKPPQTPKPPGKTAFDASLSSDKDASSMFDFSELANPDGWENAVMKKDNGPRSERPRSTWKMTSNKAAEIDEGSMDYLGIYSEDVFLARATRIINEKTPWDDEPLFLYIAHQAVHAPLTPVPEDAFSEEEEAILTSIESTKESRLAFSRSLMYLDKKVGELVHTLEENGWLDNSIIVVASDNGGCPSEGSINYPLRGTKETYFEGGIKVPAFIYSKSHLPEKVWGSSYNHPMHVTDWVPTFASAVGYDLGGSPGPLDGVDHWDSIINPTENSVPPRDEILFNWDDYILSSSEELTPNEQLTQGAFRQGKWKLITNQWCSNYVSYDPNTQDDALLSNNICGTMKVCPACVTTCSGDVKYTYHDWLFDLENDPREVTNLAEVYPETVSRLRERAREVVHADYGHSGYQAVDRQAYRIWADNGCWIFPWYRLAHSAPSL